MLICMYNILVPKIADNDYLGVENCSLKNFDSFNTLNFQVDFHLNTSQK